MEEVWKDINLASLQDNSSRKGLSVNPNPEAQHFIVQDFLARTFRKDLPTNRVSPLPPTATFLNLNSSPDFDKSPSALDSFNKKGVQEPDCASGDRRHKRMIKNRESAARSRARKRAYTTELEIEVVHLMEENARLKRKQEQLRADVAAPLPKRSKLLRTLTAPF
ncbi:hypothetical protein like AT4G35900 [Hibiscus trionum]|uniref:BZIP domain-containing protein n=1 Tax=Hibiscus trionum TaxID=183268 RepID=A0A9W7HGH4_HIBTR|nr:hypothetical protein like AT4G35900 [Hibiscus trionum]